MHSCSSTKKPNLGGHWQLSADNGVSLSLPCCSEWENLWVLKFLSTSFSPFTFHSHPGGHVPLMTMRDTCVWMKASCHVGDAFSVTPNQKLLWLDVFPQFLSLSFLSGWACFLFVPFILLLLLFEWVEPWGRLNAATSSALSPTQEPVQRAAHAHGTQAQRGHPQKVLGGQAGAPKHAGAAQEPDGWRELYPWLGHQGCCSVRKPSIVSRCWLLLDPKERKYTSLTLDDCRV